MKMVIIGGSGLIGSMLVAKLRQDGRDVVSADLDSGVNTVTGQGLSDALRGVSVVVDVSNSPSYEEAAVLEFFETSTRNLLDAEFEAGVGHHAQEKLIPSSSIPYSIVHATQFFEFILRIADSHTTGDTVRVPPVLVQPMAAADDVASAIAAVSVGAARNGSIEIGGPEQFRLDELIRRALEARDDERRVIADPNAPYFGGQLSERTLVPGGDAQLGAPRFNDWSAQQ